MKCHACKCDVTPAKPRSTWKAITVAFWVACLVVSIPFSLVIGLNLLLAPAAICIGFAVGTASRRMGSWTCPRCNVELLEPEPQTKIETVPLAMVARRS